MFEELIPIFANIAEYGQATISALVLWLYIRQSKRLNLLGDRLSEIQKDHAETIDSIRQEHNGEYVKLVKENIQVITKLMTCMRYFMKDKED